MQVSHDREGFTTFFDIKLFAIMKGGRGCEVSGIPGAGVTIRSAGMQALDDGRCPVRGQSLIVASMATRRDWYTFSSLTPFSFPRATSTTMVGGLRGVTSGKHDVQVHAGVPRRIHRVNQSRPSSRPDP
jgi:hypothetical protein